LALANAPLASTSRRATRNKERYGWFESRLALGLLSPIADDLRFQVVGRGNVRSAGMPIRQTCGMSEADDLRSEVDALRRELADLRAGLCHCLGKYGRRQSGPQGLTVLTVLSDLEIFEEICRLRGIAEGRRTD